MDKKTKLYVGIGLLGVGAYLYAKSSKNMVGATGRGFGKRPPKWYQVINPFYWFGTHHITVPSQAPVPDTTVLPKPDYDIFGINVDTSAVHRSTISSAAQAQANIRGGAYDGGVGGEYGSGVGNIKINLPKPSPTFPK